LYENILIEEIKETKKLKALLYTNQYNILTIDRLIQQAARRNPSSFHVWYAWGVIKKLQDDLIAAENKLRKALHLEPSNISAQHELGRVLTFLGHHAEAEQLLVNILASDPPISPEQRIEILLHIADNYIHWANNEFAKKKYKMWIDHTKKAFNFTLFTIDLAPNDRRVHELHKKICLDFGTRMFKIRKKNEGKNYLLKVIAEFAYKNQKIPINKEVLSTAYYFLAKYEKSKSPPDLEKIKFYSKKGLEVTTEEKIAKSFEKYLKFVRNEKKRLSGEVLHYNEKRKFGIIKSKGLSCIFFPKFLNWYCRDLSSLVGQKVSFIPVPHPTTKKQNNFKAVSIQLIKT
jgi:hypothetical protein